MEGNYAELGAFAIIFGFAIKEFFSYLKSRKNGSDNHIQHGKQIFDELQLMNNNHLHSIEEAIKDGNRDTVKAITDGNLKVVEMLGEIKGNLNSRQ